MVYSFTNSPDGVNPEYLIIDKFGDIYGVTSAGGASTTGTGAGTVFELQPNADGRLLRDCAVQLYGQPGW